MARIEIGPQPGFQTRYLASKASILIGGGAAGCGKTFINLVDAARHMKVPNYAAVLFRRTTKQIKHPGALWDQSRRVYPLLGATSNISDLEWAWPSPAKVKMSHIEHADNIFDWQSAEIARVLFDELTHFTEEMFFYMLSRNRTTCGVRPRMRATCNPDADSWVAKLVEWWIEQDANHPRYGLPIPEREGVLRYLVRVGDEMVFGSDRDEAARLGGVTSDVPRSLTFIPGRLDENKILERADPSYRHRLMAMTRVERERLLNGNWKVKAHAGDYFKRNEVTMLNEAPTDVVRVVRRWDLAASEPNEVRPDPDWTCGVKMGKRKSGRYVVLHAEFTRARSAAVRDVVRRTAVNDTRDVKVIVPQDPGQAGKDQVASYATLLDGFDIEEERETGDKETRAEPFASQWQAGNVDVVRGPWNDEYFRQMEGFPSKQMHDDAVDASTGAHKALSGALSIADAY